MDAVGLLLDDQGTQQGKRQLTSCTLEVLLQAASSTANLAILDWSRPSCDIPWQRFRQGALKAAMRTGQGLGDATQHLTANMSCTVQRKSFPKKSKSL